MPEKSADFRSEKSADFRSVKSADFRFEQKLKKLSKRPRRTKRQQQIDTQHQNTQEVELNLSQQTGDCQCYYCGEMIAYKVIQDHMKSAHGRFHRKMYGEPRPLQCQVCKATFEKQSALTTHSCYTNFIPTKVRGGDPYRCDICNKTFTVKMGLRSHLNTVNIAQRPRTDLK